MRPLTFSCINANSLNMSTSSKSNQDRKIYGITKLKTDFVFISDTRICNKNLVPAGNDICKMFRTNPYMQYQFFYNSSSNKRGVGILINNKISFSEIARETDPEENYLLLKLNIQGITIIVWGSLWSKYIQP
jgi:hypothetical protein